MTQSNPPPAPSPMADIVARMKAYEARAAALMPANKASLFAVLAPAGITRIDVTFDGYGDSGQIEDVQAYAGDTPAALPEAPLTLRSVSFHDEEIREQEMTVAEAVETLSYNALSQTHGGWEDNDGAYGAFVFDVAAGTIRLDYNERYTSVDAHHHDF
ncbi:DUF6878 family protein (plasmid) [Glycocaulis abyssi]|uniref:DUF6878 family protein n=1 Tax=Glycocaulis abyssi TaxID=1433403 RepID=A0ABV9NGD0_9PROT|nr:hypothetical protein FKB34_15960 [Glycocaulis profundi]